MFFFLSSLEMLWTHWQSASGQRRTWIPSRGLFRLHHAMRRCCLTTRTMDCTLNANSSRPAIDERVACAHALRPSRYRGSQMIICQVDRVHSVRTVHILLGNYTSFTPKTEPHHKALHSNTCTKRTTSTWSSDQPSTTTAVQRCAPDEHATSPVHCCILPVSHLPSILAQKKKHTEMAHQMVRPLRALSRKE